MRWWIYLLIILITGTASAVVLFTFGNDFWISAEEKACIDFGGEVASLSCCGSAKDFPNTCTMTLCDCSPAASHTVKSCVCGQGMCFNGTGCVAQG